MEDGLPEGFAEDFGEAERKDEATRMAGLDSRTPEKWHPRLKSPLGFGGKSQGSGVAKATCSLQL